MKTTTLPRFAILLGLGILGLTLSAQPAPAPVGDAPAVLWKPNKVLIVIGDQWADPNSEIIDGPHGEGHPVSYVKQARSALRTGDTFWRITAYLRTCGIPFDLLRLDQSELRLNHFLDHRLRPAYGAVIWDVDQDTVPARDYDVLTRVVREHGISLIALGDSIKPPALLDLLGLGWTRESYHSDAAPIRVTGGHYITRGLEGDHPPARGSDVSYKPLVTATAATVLATQAGHPALTVREVDGRASAIWLGGDPARLLENHPFVLRMLRRALVHGIGYSVYRTFPRTALLTMDDPTCTAMFADWHFPALTEQEIVDRIVRPLQERKAVMQLNMVPGRLMDGSRMVEPNWTQDYTDALGERQDLVSNGRGWRRGIEAGLFEVQSHGWTHRNPHWELYWSAGLSHRLHPYWGSEFFDRMRGEEIPNTVQLFAMKRSIEALEQEWGQRPLCFRPGQAAESFSYANHTPRLARKAGFALTWDFWLGPDYIINLRPYLFPPGNERDIPGLEGERPAYMLSHDYDVFQDPDFIRKRLAEFGPEYRFTTINEIIAYLFADVRGGAGGRIEFRYAPDFCRHFATRGSDWELHLSDAFRQELNRRGPAGAAVDGKPVAPPVAGYFQERMEIALPAGTGRHVWEVRQ